MKPGPRTIAICLAALAILALAGLLAKFGAVPPILTPRTAMNPGVTPPVGATRTSIPPTEVAATPTDQAGSRPEQVFVVEVSGKAFDSLGAFQALSVYRHKSVVWLELTAEQYQAFLSHGVPDQSYQVMRDGYYILDFFDYHFDPLHAEPALPPELVSAYAPGSRGLYRVQWQGPLEDEYIETLRSMGVVFVEQWTEVMMTPEQALRVRALDFVRWVGVVHAAYRVRPRLFASTNATEKVVLVVFNDHKASGSVEHVIKAIEGFRGQVTADDRPYISPTSTTASLYVDLPTQALTATAQLNDVILIDNGPSNKIE